MILETTVNHSNGLLHCLAARDYSGDADTVAHPRGEGGGVWKEGGHVALVHSIVFSLMRLFDQFYESDIKH